MATFHLYFRKLTGVFYIGKDTVKVKTALQKIKTDKEDSIQECGNSGERLNSTLLERRAGEFLRTSEEGLTALCVWSLVLPKGKVNFLYLHDKR